MNFSFKRWFGTAWFCLLQGAFVFLSGASPLNVLFYEVAFEGATQFHHGNWRLPLKVERGLNRVFVTPRMHGIHHYVIREETDSNYSVIFSFWDRLHNTMRLMYNKRKL